MRNSARYIENHGRLSYRLLLQIGLDFIILWTENYGGRLAPMGGVRAFVIVKLDPPGDPGPGF